ncbi:MAG: 4a-hydroxytetrahydrobiopterin dehydratase [Candidatus Micrarchaeaceae archaeon]
MDLAKKKCVPCEGGTKPMGRADALRNMGFLDGWNFKGNSISKDMEFKDFNGAMRFINKLWKIAESEGHHPDIYLHGWNKVRITLSTHAIGGLSINDFILAAKADRIR